MLCSKWLTTVTTLAAVTNGILQRSNLKIPLRENVALMPTRNYLADSKLLILSRIWDRGWKCILTIGLLYHDLAKILCKKACLFSRYRFVSKSVVRNKTNYFFFQAFYLQALIRWYLLIKQIYRKSYFWHTSSVFDKS